MNRFHLTFVTIRPLIPILVLVWVLVHAGSADLARGETQTVALPITLDYPFIRSLLMEQTYTAPGGRLVMEAMGACTQMELWEPEVSYENDALKIGSKILVHYGVNLMGWCVDLKTWSGYAEVLQRPHLEPDPWGVRLETVDLRLYDLRHKNAWLTGFVSNRIKPHFAAAMNRIRIDLSLPVGELQAVLPLFFAGEQQDQAAQWLESLRPGAPGFTDAAMRLNLLMDVNPGPPPDSYPALSAEVGLERLIALWQSWDPFFVYQIAVLAGREIEDADRAMLLNTLLEMRHRFVHAIDQQGGDPDLVRREFSWAWNEISAILRKHLLGAPSPWLLNHLAFMTVSDAVTILEGLGSAMRIEISRDGLARAATLLSQTAQAPDLVYTYEPDPRLRELLGLPPLTEADEPATDIEEMDLPEAPPEPTELEFWMSRLPWFASVAFAAEFEPLDPSAIARWLPPRKPEDFPAYMETVGQVLHNATEHVRLSSSSRDDHRSLFALLVPATAWQESCWRQFVARQGKVRYLLSYNNTSVGIMQINEKVWRGLYRVEDLRWNIRYNAMAGVEILDLYLRKYALKPGALDPLPEDDALAVVLYAMYNGGPGELRRFKGAAADRREKTIDRLFREKYDRVKAGQLNRLSICHFGQRN